MCLFHQWFYKRRPLTRLGACESVDHLLALSPDLQSLCEGVEDTVTPVRLSVEMPFDYLVVEAPTVRTRL